ncbi:hypothetical protein [Halomarina pelagica]|uniref:hypothetical protein n=1 Tax=Halomarina pelagica TaxID=2961599 RepID=UPI0020C50D7A|nr:hypothetical protein [Halomarina sp. BND7]
MNRRQVLAGIGAVCVSALPGCATVVGETRLGRPTVEAERDGATHVTFSDGGELTTSSLYSDGVDDRGRFDLRSDTWHRDGTRLDSARFAFRDARTAYGGRDAGSIPSLKLYLGTPGGYPFPKVYFDRGDDHEWSILEIPDLGVQGGSTLSLEFIGQVFHDYRPVLLDFDLRLELSETGLLGGGYVAETVQRIEVPVEESTSD